MGLVNSMWDRDLRRTVAMKMALEPSGSRDKQPWDTSGERERAFLGRFLGEAQLTGQLEHPGVVPVHDIGIDDRGQIYFTMRLVKGESLHEIIRKVHRDESSWNRTRALGVVLKVCETMAYAHEKKVIHRDLKPENIMVGRFGEVYVMDWGLARVQGQPDPAERRLRLEETRFHSAIHTVRAEVENSETPWITSEGDVLGTPSFMPPEQARGNLDLIEPRSDVYSVGAILYHLLTGVPPFLEPGVRVKRAQIIWRLIEGPEPKAIDAFDPSIPGELVAICNKAMSREIRDRYGSMLEMAEDMRAFLEHRVVHAYERGALADLRKWVRRNRSLAASLFVALALAMGGLTSTTYVYAVGKNKADEATTRAERAAAVAESVSDFLNRDLLLKALDPNEVRGEQLTVREVLDKASIELEHAFLDEPGIRAELFATVGESYLNLGALDTAVTTLEEALRLGEEVYGPDSLECADILVLLAEAVHRYSDDDIRALELCERATENLARTLDPLHPKLLRCRVKTTEYRAFVAGESAPGVAREHVEIFHRARVKQGIDEAGRPLRELQDLVDESIARLDVLWSRGAYGQATELVSGLLAPLLEDDALALFANDIPWGLSAFGATQFEIGYYPHAGEALATLGAQWSAEKLGPEHRKTLICRRNLARIWASTDRADRARAEMREIIRISRKNFGPSHRDTLHRVRELGLIHARLGESELAESCFSEVIELGRSEENFRTEVMMAYDALVDLRLARGQSESAVELLREAIRVGPARGRVRQEREARLEALTGSEDD